MTCHIQSSSRQTSTLHKHIQTRSAAGVLSLSRVQLLFGWSIRRSIRPVMNQSIDSCLKATSFSSPPRRSSAQSASDRHNGAARSDRVRDVGPRVDALRRRDVQTRREDVVWQLHRLADTLLVRWRRLRRKEDKLDQIFLLFLLYFKQQ